MSYMDQALLSRDSDFAQRIAAAAVLEVDDLGDEMPLDWAARNQWAIAAAPGFADAYGSALVGGVPRPGADPAVISDAQILSAMQALFPDTP